MYYSKELEPIDLGEGTWNYKRIGIFDDEKQIGEFTRTYPSYGIETFYPFMYKGEWYALYSPEYVAISVVSLPSCEEVATMNKEDGCGFCPVESWVPTYKSKIESYSFKKDGKEIEKDLYIYYSEKDFDEECEELELKYHDFAFIAGCVWGDDTSWKIQLLDLSKLDKGEISYKEDLGYQELPGNLTLKHAINIDSDDEGYYFITMAVQRHVRLNNGMVKVFNDHTNEWEPEKDGKLET